MIPFSDRGTTVIEAELLKSNVVSNDINPLSEILTRPRFFITDISEIAQRLNEIIFNTTAKADIDLSMFYHPQTEAEIMSLENYLIAKKEDGKEERVDSWIRITVGGRADNSPPWKLDGIEPPTHTVSLLLLLHG